MVEISARSNDRCMLWSCDDSLLIKLLKCLFVLYYDYWMIRPIEYELRQLYIWHANLFYNIWVCVCVCVCLIFSFFWDGVPWKHRSLSSSIEKEVFWYPYHLGHSCWIFSPNLIRVLVNANSYTLHCAHV